MPNRLAQEPSPYLQQHRDNPVDWWPWSDEALAEAQRRDVPLLVSIGYSSCHWCHVMAHESFENDEIAAYMNEHFVNVKVDREERPDVDAIYMSAVQAMTGHGGWPLNVFATPEGTPFFGGTYWPPVDSRGMPGFPLVLQSIVRAWEQDRAALIENAGRITTFLESASQQRQFSGVVSESIADDALAQLSSAYDTAAGGFGSAPKFPQAPTLDFLARHHRRTGSELALAMLTGTLDAMAAGGIYDQIGGGFARYAVDRDWVVPHFEKMLYDNAQLMGVYLDAWRATGAPRYAQVVVETGEWLLREMRLADSGFASALDADSEGVEGRFYVWSDAEIDAALPDDLATVIRQRFGITPQGNFEGENVLTVAATVDEIASETELTAEDITSALEAGVAILRDHRLRRVRPGQDDKVVTAWNGLAISALARAGAVLRMPTFLAAAQRAADFLLGAVRREDGTLWRTWKDGQCRGNGVLEDYVCLAEGLIHLHQADGEIRWLREADDLLATAIRDFGREGGPDFFDTPATGTGLAVRPHSVQDNATPAGNSVAADVMVTLGTLTDRTELVERAEAILSALTDVLREHPEAFGRLLAVAERLYHPASTLVIGGEPDAPGHLRLTRAALAAEGPDLVIAHATPGLAAPDLDRFPVFRERTGQDGASAAWLCRGTSCLLPAFTVTELEDRLARARSEMQTGQATR